LKTEVIGGELKEGIAVVIGTKPMDLLPGNNGSKIPKKTKPVRVFDPGLIQPGIVGSGAAGVIARPWRTGSGE
jgi:hypothetical protein